MKGKKSLVDLKNFRSTRLKELTSSSKSLGAISIGIRTTSFSYLPPSYVISKDSIKMCEFVGSYTPISSDSIYKKYNSNNLIYLANNADKSGWYYYNNPNGGYTNFSGTTFAFGKVEGYLFLFFKSIDTDGYIRYICGQCDDGDAGRGVCKTFDTHQGPIFAVVIQNIAQINALNQTGAVQSNESFLSTTINNALNSDNPIIKYVINDIRNNNDTTLIISPIPNPITVITNDYIDIDLSTVNETSGDGNNLSAYKDFDISKLIKRENFVNNMGSIKFTEFMLTRYTSGINAFFLLQGGGESTILGSLDQLDKPNSIGGLGLIRVRRETLGFGSLFGGYEGNRIGSFEIGFTQPYYEIQNQAYTSKRLSIKFRVTFK